jgi:hypothetical protein
MLLFAARYSQRAVCRTVVVNHMCL